MARKRFEARLQEALDTAPVIDPHCHLRAEHPHASNLADLLLYHHVWIELVSAGMPPTAVSKKGLPHELTPPEMDSDERVKACLPYLSRIRNTLSMRFLRWMLEDIFGIRGGHLNDGNWRDVAQQVERNGADPNWGFEFLRKRCGIQSALTVESRARKGEARGESGIAQIGYGREVRPLITLENAKTSPAQTLRGLEGGWERAGMLKPGEILTGDLFAEKLDAQVRDAAGGLRYFGIWVPPYLQLSDPTASEITQLLGRVRGGGGVTREDHSTFTSFALRRLLEAVRKTNVRTIQTIVGAEVLLPHRSLPQWDGAFVGSIGRLAGLFEDLHFDVSAACDVFIHDLAILAKHVPNVSVAGYWWHALYPSLVRKSIELRLDAVPANKITAFFSDAYHCEWCYPKLRMVKQIFHQVLSERVATGWYDEETVLSLVRPLFWENPLRIYYGVR